MRAAPCVLALAALSACLGADSAGRTFDPLVTQSFIESACKKSGATFHTASKDGIRTYAASYPVPKTKPDQHYDLSISIGRAGAFLDRAAYEQRYEETRTKFADRGPEYLEAEFPRIGKRARRELFGFGPGGSSQGVTFTTDDERYDVRVMLSELLPAGVDAPACDAKEIARALAAAYGKRK